VVTYFQYYYFLSTVRYVYQVVHYYYGLKMNTNKNHIISCYTLFISLLHINVSDSMKYVTLHTNGMFRIFSFAVVDRKKDAYILISFENKICIFYVFSYITKFVFKIIKLRVKYNTILTEYLDCRYLL
jgi:hypothetical protein